MKNVLSVKIQEFGSELFGVLLAIILYMVIAILLLCGCSFESIVGDGRGDWCLNLQDGYGITRVNSRCIAVTYQENPNDTDVSFVIDNYYVKAYRLYMQYACFEGIPTEERFASEAELNSTLRNYYIVDTSKGNVIGPFESYNVFQDECMAQGIELTDEWLRPQRQ